MDDTSISTLNKGKGSKSDGMSVFAMAMVDLLNFFGAEWTDGQILSVSEVFYDECHWFTFPELKHFVRKCKAMKFGKLYGKFTTAVFMDWVTTYSEEAFEKRTNHFKEKSKKVNWVEPTNPVPPEKFSELVADLAKQLQDSKEEEQKDADAANLRRQEQIIAYNDMLRTAYENKTAKKAYTDKQVPDTEQNEIPL